ncbi:desmocollin-1-like isoform X1 [Oenanthe melanoleuca]|uniref:desmocollin-1-like isoform X1 n=1 Tax=Oenanthe melanoleuca TaxID=2939378 RepID=UPI0024C1585B|nr:desmocollin-1-like isoform X1 [Oenanthe melanoleuca]
MAPTAPRLVLGLLVLSLCCEACKKVIFHVPSELEADTLVGRVDLNECLQSAEFISSSDENFKVLEDGSVYTTSALSLSTGKKTFTILLKDIQEQVQKKIHVSVVEEAKKTPKTRHARDTILKRTKRRWGPIPSVMIENSLGPFPLQIQQVQSDTAQNYTIYYSASGPGIDQDPKGLFYIERETGNIFATRAVDREQYPSFQIICFATTPDGYSPEVPLVHTIRIEDDNDNAPYFTQDLFEFCVPENSRPGVVVGKVIAEDRDEPYTLHTTLKYRIVSQTPPITPAFSLHGDTGVISVLLPQLDRELVPSYTLLVEVRDMAGQPFGLCTTGTVVIKIEDTNDNAPSFKQLQYETRVEENRVSVEILRVSVVDLDEPGSPGSGAVYEIIRGNDDQAFEITTDKNTNEGILCVVKGLDYEAAKQRILVIGVNNEAPYLLAPHSQQLSQSTCSVTVHVLDVDEGPVFKPCLLRLDVKECEDVGTAIGRFVAQDPETGNSEGIRYRIPPGQCNWVNIDDKSGEIRTVRVLDRDIGEMRRGQCNVTVLAIDRNGKTGTGTIQVCIVPGNKNFPRIMQTDYIMCRDRKPICLRAEDSDEAPYSAPFVYRITDQRLASMWKLTPHDDNSWYLSPKSDIPYGIYEIPVSVTDNGGKIGENTIRVNLCDCVTPTECDGRTRQLSGGNVTLGLWAILAMILGSLLLLLILITICGCCGAGVMHRQVTDDCANHNLIISNTEAPGEEVMDHNIIPLQNTCGQGGYGVKTGEQQTFEMAKGRGHTLESAKGVGHQTLGSVQEGGGQPMMDTCRYSYSEWHNFTHPRLGEKVHLCRQDEEQKHSEDYLLSYNYEGKGSLAGSVGCCSDQHEEEALDFLDQLEPKFRTLAETCIKR